jgi:E3 ubiquitin-protein ligase HUWE1
VNPRSHIQKNYLEKFRFAGVIVAHAVIDSLPLRVCACWALLKQLLGISVTMQDLKDFDESIYNSLTGLRNPDMDLGEVGLRFEIELRAADPSQTVLLKPGGNEIEVTSQRDLNEYIRPFLDFRLEGEFKAQLKAFVEGFHSLIPQKEISMFSPDELGMLISGVPDIDPDEFAEHVAFVTGVCRVPAEGFESYAKDGHPFTIVQKRTTDLLPIAHTCARILGLPPYQTKEDMKDKLILALNWSEAAGFGFI